MIFIQFFIILMLMKHMMEIYDLLLLNFVFLHSYSLLSLQITFDCFIILTMILLKYFLLFTSI